MARLQRNAVANFAGQVWAAALALLLVPLYIRFLGIEAYGLIGVYAMLQASFQVLDLGLSQTMNREMARYAVFHDKAAEQRDLARSIEVAYWLVGGALGLALAVAAPLVARHWVHASSLPSSAVQHAVAIMGLVVALQWPLSLYAGGMMGLQHQVLLSSLNAGMATLGGVGAILILWLVSPTVTAYFAWQAAVSAMNVLLVAVVFWRCLPPCDRRPHFNLRLLVANSRFALGMGGISVSAIVLMQLDKVLLSKLLSLEMFGYYTLAGTISSVVPTLLVGPVFNASFPRLTSLVASGDERGLTRLYHGVTQVVGVLAVTVACVLCLFSWDILWLWTRDAATAAAASPLLSVLVVGMALNALMTPAYALQLAHGWTGIGLRINAGLMILLVPSIIVLTARYGAVGGAAAWVVLNTIYVLVGIPLTHRRLLKTEMRSWFLKDILPPFAVSVLVAGAGRLLFGSRAAPLATAMAISATLLGGLLGAALSAPITREWLLRNLSSIRATSAQ